MENSAAEGTGTPKRRRRFASPKALATGVVTVAVIGGSTAAITVVAASSQTPAGRVAATAPAAASGQVELPTGYGRPIALSADPVNGSIWFLDGNNTGASALSWNPKAQSLAHYQFSSLAQPLDFGVQAGLVVDRSGIVWIGVGKTLVRLDPSTGQMTEIAIPAVRTDPTLSGGPGGVDGIPRLYSTHAITGLVVTTDEDIAISLSWATTILTYSPSTGQFATVGLPSGDVPTGLASVPNGDLVVSASASKAMDTIGADGSVQRTDQFDGYNVGCGTSGCAWSVNSELFQASTTGIAAAQAAAGSSGQKVTAVTLAAADIRIGGTPTPLKDGRTIAPTTDGFVVVGATMVASQAKPYALPKGQCTIPGPAQPSDSNSAAGSSTPIVTSCSQSPIDYVVDPAGNVWFTTNLGAPTIYEMPAGSY